MGCRVDGRTHQRQLDVYTRRIYTQPMPKILFHCSPEEKALWVIASTGEAKTLSQWIRDHCNAALTERGGTATPGRTDSEVRYRTQDHGEPEVPVASRSASAAKPKKAKPVGCSRERHHRPGAYCKVCGATA